MAEWENPWTGRCVEVLPVLNDPVNQRWREETPWGPFRLPATDLGDRVCFNIDIPLACPSPLPVAEFPENSADDTYRALEFFSIFTDRAALASDATSVPCELTWMRQSPWLPWMRMGTRPGGLVFHTRGRKLSSYAELPGWLRDHLAAEHPAFASAPEEFSEPNETSWTAFRERAER